MKTVSIDRFEGKYAVCEDKDGGLFGIESTELPEGAKEGTVLQIDDTEGILQIDQQETDRRRKQNARLQNDVFSR
ncbi:DUF3006 domain-containing protein [Caproicibacterium sp. XB2]|uniref:DUF3006 domain-containing protein n=1 Tax=Caproicibacterium sp. XB2 TaxID=3388458 RepID=UPI00384E76F2